MDFVATKFTTATIDYSRLENVVHTFAKESPLFMGWEKGINR
jgi:hypothetical protein